MIKELNGCVKFFGIEFIYGYNSRAKTIRKIRELTKLYRDVSGDKKANVLPPIQWSGNIQEEISDEQSENEPAE